MGYTFILIQLVFLGVIVKEKTSLENRKKTLDFGLGVVSFS